MAMYDPRYINNFLQKITDDEFKIPRGPGEYVIRAGIYRCESCGTEIVHPGNGELPDHSGNDSHWHKWKLIVSTDYPYRRFNMFEKK
jgi:hypothetical protein